MTETCYHEIALSMCKECLNDKVYELRELREILGEALEDIESNWDHENKSGGFCWSYEEHPEQQCRCCIARAALKKAGWIK